jgi:2'-5' RNA ligase
VKDFEMNPETSSPSALRLFIAISLPEPVKVEIEKAQAEMRRALPGDFMRWTEREQFHLTLKFLGNVEAQHLDALSESLRAVCRTFSPLRLRAAQVGFFPDSHRPRVVWVAVGDEKNSLPSLQAAIEAAVQEFTVETAEGKFSGHVTLARCKMIKRPQAEILARLAAGIADKVFGEWTADAIELIRSELSPGGPRYTVLASPPLAK